MNRLQLVISYMIGPEQTFAVKRRSIQDNLLLIREVLEGIEDGTEAALICLAWRCSDTLPGPFRRSNGHVCILGVWFGPDLQLERNWSEVQAKVNAHVESGFQGGCP